MEEKLELSREMFEHLFDPLTESQKSELDKKIYSEQGYPRPEKQYDKYGLRFPIDHLRSAGNWVAILPTQYLAEYCDVITKTRIDDNDPLFIQNVMEAFKDVDANEVLFHSNATSLGNTAYIALYCKEPKAVEACKDFLFFAMNEKLKHLSKIAGQIESEQIQPNGVAKEKPLPDGRVDRRN